MHVAQCNDGALCFGQLFDGFFDGGVYLFGEQLVLWALIPAIRVGLPLARVVLARRIKVMFCDKMPSEL